MSHRLALLETTGFAFSATGFGMTATGFTTTITTTTMPKRAGMV